MCVFMILLDYSCTERCNGKQHTCTTKPVPFRHSNAAVPCPATTSSTSSAVRPWYELDFIQTSLPRCFVQLPRTDFYFCQRSLLGFEDFVESLFRLLAAPLLATDRRFCRSLRTAVHNRPTSAICTNPDLNAGSANSKATFVLGN